MIDDKVARHLNVIHQRRVDEVNQGRREKPVYKVREMVWFRRLASLFARLHSIWEGPHGVLWRMGQGSYVISTPVAAEQTVHEDQLKPFVEDRFVSETIPLHYYGCMTPE